MHHDEVISPVMTTDLPLPILRRGKVRDVYRCTTAGGEDAVLLVATDRVSAFDVVMPTPVPGKGVLLTRIAAFWLGLVGERFGEGLPHHLLSCDAGEVEGLDAATAAGLAGRVMVGRAAEVVPIECVVRGYLAGSGWKEYRATGRVCGVELPAGMREAQRLPEPIFTPAGKAEQGHDENITFEQACDRVGGGVMHRLREWSLRLYAMGGEHAAARGLILADTKFEYGHARDRGGIDAGVDSLVLIDEVLTPDSSRFWPAESYQPGGEQPSFDKQFVRDHLQALADAGVWDKTPPGPDLPAVIVEQTLERYREAEQRITQRR